MSYIDVIKVYDKNMQLKTIKSKIGNPEYTQFLEKEIELIKKQCNISASESVYFLCHHKWKQIFLINGIIYVANVSCELDKNRHRIISTMSLVELYKIKFTKVAVINFKSPTYHIKGIYKRGNTKAKRWELTKKEIKELVNFLNSPSDRADDYGSGQLYEAYKKYVKNNWQQLIFEYNHNTAGWGWGDSEFDIPPEKDTDRFTEIEALPFDLPMPDYTELIKE